MTVDPDARIRSLPGVEAPQIADSAWVAPGAALIGHVCVHARSSVWYNSVLRAEDEKIELGEGSNLQDNVSCHVDKGFPLTIGSNVSVGHGAVLHGCTIEDNVLIGMSATILNGSIIGTESLIAAGTVMLEGTIVPPRSLVAGVPGKVRRELSDDELAAIRQNARFYVELMQLHSS